MQIEKDICRNKMIKVKRNIICVSALTAVFLLMHNCISNKAFAETVWQISSEEIEKYNAGTIDDFPGGYAGQNNYKYCFYYQYANEKNEIIENEITLFSNSLNMTYDQFNKTNIEALIPKADLYLDYLNSYDVYKLLCKHIAMGEQTTSEEISNMIIEGKIILKKCMAYINVNVKLKRDDSFLGSTYDRMKSDIIDSSWLNLGFVKGNMTSHQKFITNYKSTRIYDYRKLVNVGSKNVETWCSKVKKYNIDFNSKFEFYDQTYDTTDYTLSKIFTTSVNNPINVELIPIPNCREQFVFRGWYTEKNGKGVQVLNENNQLSRYKDSEGNTIINRRIYSINNLKLYAYYLCKVTPYVKEEDGTIKRYTINNTNFDFLIGYGMNLSDAYDPVIPTTIPVDVDGKKYSVWYNENFNAIYPYTFAIRKNEKIYIIKGNNEEIKVSFYVQNKNGEYELYKVVPKTINSFLSSIEVPNIPSLEGYSVNGWTTEKNGSGTLLNYSELLNADKTYYANYRKNEIVNYSKPYVKFEVSEEKEWYNSDIEVTAKLVIPNNYYENGYLINTKTSEKKETKILFDKIKSGNVTSPGISVISNNNGIIKFKIDKESLNANNSWMIKVDFNIVASGKTKDINIESLSSDWKIENLASYENNVSATSKVYRIDKTIPEYKFEVVEEQGSKRVIIEAFDKLSGLVEAYVKIDGNDKIDILSEKFNRIFSDLESHKIEIYAKDKAENELITSVIQEVDNTAPIVKYGFSNLKVAENKDSKKNRFEATSMNAEYFIYVSDKKDDEVSSGIKEVRCKIVDKQHLVNGLEIKTTGNKLTTYDKFVKLTIPQELIKNGKETYLVIYAVDNAGNETYTVKSNVVFPNEFAKYELITATTSPATRGFVGPLKHYDAGISKREIPTGMLYINRSNIVDNSPLKCISAYDVKWKNSLLTPALLNDFPIYKNVFNDTIGLGYRVNFRYDQVGYGTDNGDITNIAINIYGKVGTEYKKLFVYDNVSGDFIKADVNGKYYKKSFMKRVNTNFNGDVSKIPQDVGEYEIVDNDNSRLYFNYIIPHSSRFKYLSNGSEVFFNGNEILLTFDLVSYKYTDLDNNTLYRLLDDNTVSINRDTTNLKTNYGVTNRIEGVDDIQVFWYDLVLTALQDVSGGRR